MHILTLRMVLYLDPKWFLRLGPSFLCFSYPAVLLVHDVLTYWSPFSAREWVRRHSNNVRQALHLIGS